MPNASLVAGLFELKTLLLLGLVLSQLMLRPYIKAEK